MIAFRAGQQEFAFGAVTALYKHCEPAETSASSSLKVADEDDHQFVNIGIGVNQLTFYIGATLDGVDSRARMRLNNLILRAIIDCKRIGKLDQALFLENLNRRQGEWLAQEKQSFTCFFVAHLHQPVDYVPATVLGKETRAIEYSDIQKALAGRDPKTVWNWHTSPIKSWELHTFVPMVVKADAITLEDALLDAWQAVEIIRASLNWARAMTTQTWYFGKPRERALFHVPPLWACVRDNEIVAANEYHHRPDYRLEKLDEVELALARSMMERFSQEPSEGTSLHRLKRALLAFNEALDYEGLPEQFLGLWRSLEILANTSGGNTDLVCKRISNLWRDGSGILHRLKALAPVRNRLVHEAEFLPGNQPPVVELLNFCAAASSEFANMSQDLATDGHFDDYFSVCTLGPAGLRRMLGVCDFVLSRKT